MSSDINSLIIKKKPVLNSIILKENEIQFSKGINSDTISCAKLICDDIEINNSGETQIDNAVITNSKINSTNIGIIKPARGIFNRFQLKSSGNLSNTFLIDSDLNINNTIFVDQVRNISSINPLNIQSKQYLIINSNNELTLKTNKNIKLNAITNINLTTPNIIQFNSNTLNINSTITNSYSKIIFHNLNDSNDFNNSSVLFKGGIFIQKNINLQGTFISNNNIDAINIHNSSFILKGGASIQKNLYIGKDINIFGKSIIHNYTQSNDLKIFTLA